MRWISEAQFVHWCWFSECFGTGAVEHSAMKKRRANQGPWIAFTHGFLALVLSGCGNSNTQAQINPLGAGSQQSTLSVIHPAGTGKKKLGPYWLVWHAVKVSPNATEQINAVCPTNYVATGGGYVAAEPPNSAGIWIYASAPLNENKRRSDNGWMVIAFNHLPYNGYSVESDAVCAPTV